MAYPNMSWPNGEQGLTTTTDSPDWVESESYLVRIIPITGTAHWYLVHVESNDAIDITEASRSVTVGNQLAHMHVDLREIDETWRQRLFSVFADLEMVWRVTDEDADEMVCAVHRSAVSETVIVRNAWDEAERNPGEWLGLDLPIAPPYTASITPEGLIALHETGTSANETAETFEEIRRVIRSVVTNGFADEDVVRDQWGNWIDDGDPDYREMRRQILDQQAAAHRAERDLQNTELGEDPEWFYATYRGQETETKGMTLADLLGDDVTDLIGDYRKFREEIKHDHDD